MKYIAISILVMLLTGCGSTKSKQYITIVGEARNAKAGAYMISNEDGLAYYVGGLPNWEDDISSWTKGGLHKQVMVSGYLEITKIKKIPGTQQAIGTRRTILNAKWKVISKDTISN